jgi:DMSO/TMAO reductase YedYZ molybdopterin-dependent catalytic subunit
VDGTRRANPELLLPPGQELLTKLKVKHYGRVPAGARDSWTLTFSAGGEVQDGAWHRELGRLGAIDLEALEQSRVIADLHCASGWSVQNLVWVGVAAATVMDRFPPPVGTVGVMVYAEYGYCANVRLSDLLRPTTLLAVRLDGAPLAPEHGFPVRLVVPHLYGHKSPKWFRGWEYLATPRRGFWEERGYHLIGDPWTEQRYSYQE